MPGVQLCVPKSVAKHFFAEPAGHMTVILLLACHVCVLAFIFTSFSHMSICLYHDQPLCCNSDDSEEHSPQGKTGVGHCTTCTSCSADKGQISIL